MTIYNKPFCNLVSIPFIINVLLFTDVLLSSMRFTNNIPLPITHMSLLTPQAEGRPCVATGYYY